jgi:hypothetical protein
MHVIRDESDLQGLTDPQIVQLIQRRIEDSAEYVEHFSDLVLFVLVEPGDDLAAVDDALGFPVMANRFDGIAFGEPGFTPSWDVLEEHAQFYELVWIFGDDGSGVTIFVRKTEGVSTQLLSMCRQFAPMEADT